MCGISGIISKTDEPVAKEVIGRMTSIIAHRGPDGEGFWFGRNFAIGHRRLAIIDLSANACQPMFFDDKYVITYNGEIYNYIELRDDLKARGYRFITDSDTEVILASYDCFGTECVKYFNGMWSFALYDRHKDYIFCSRDRFGVKPFYYTEEQGLFIFGSEIKQLLLFHAKPKVNMTVLADYLVAGLDDHTNETFFENIRKLEQSHSLIYNLKNHTYSVERYYSLEAKRETKGLDEDASVKTCRHILEDSIKIRLRSDVRVGTCLSGGIDSSAVATIASGMYSKKSAESFNAITACSTEPELDESAYARLVASSAGMNWHTVTPTADEFCRDVNKIIRIQEEPFGSPSLYMQYRVFSEAASRGCTVMLDGQGGDETMLGYERYYPALILSEGLLSGIKNFFESARKSKLTAWKLLLYLFYFTNPRVRLKRLRSRFFFVKPSFFSLVDRKSIFENALAYRNLKKLQHLELTRMQLPHLLKYEDRNSMHHSIESRLPFLDYRAVETALSIDDSLKMKDGWTKYILRKALVNIVPDKIIWRKDKLGFNAPEKTWLRDLDGAMRAAIQNSKILDEVTEKEKLMTGFSTLDLRVKWRLFNVAKWEELFNVRI